VPGANAGTGTVGAYGRFAGVYDLVWRDAPYDRFVDLALDVTAGARGRIRRVVVAACGTGSAALVLARRGYQVAGFDLSPAMLERAAAKCRAAGQPVRLAVGDLRAVPLRDGCADLVLALNAVLNYLLTADELVQALRQLARLTVPGGVLVVEPLSARFLHEGDDRGRHLERDGLRLDAEYQLRGDLLLERLRWTLDGVEETDAYVQRYYDDDELRALLATAGLRVLDRRPMWPAIRQQPARGRVLWALGPVSRG
jgi:SAM-dependent methyltransferase